MSLEQVDRQPKPVQRGPRILREGVIERLVAAGRIPQLHEMQQDSREIIVCYVPPEGTQIGDTEVWLHGFGLPGYESPTGEFRGPAEDVGILTPSQARQVEERIKATETSLGL